VAEEAFCLKSAPGPAFSWHGGDSSAAGVPISRHLEAHLRRSSVVGLYESRRLLTDNVSRPSCVVLFELICGHLLRRLTRRRLVIFSRWRTVQ